MDSFISLTLVLGLPPAVIAFLALVWARGRLRLILTALVFLLPLAILGALWLAAGRDGLAALGFATLAVVLLVGAIVGAVLGGLIILIRKLRRKRAAP